MGAPEKEGAACKTADSGLHQVQRRAQPGKAPVFSVCPCSSPFPGRVWEFSGLEGKSLERNVRKSEHRIRLESEEGKKGLSAAGRAGGREVEPATFPEALELSEADQATGDRRGSPARGRGPGGG